MIASELKTLMERVKSWPETAQDELAAIADDIETELQSHDYVASPRDLQIIDAAMASIDSGDIATDAEIAAVFAKFRRG